MQNIKKTKINPYEPNYLAPSAHGSMSSLSQLCVAIVSYLYGLFSRSTSLLFTPDAIYVIAPIIGMAIWTLQWKGILPSGKNKLDLRVLFVVALGDFLFIVNESAYTRMLVAVFSAAQLTISVFIGVLIATSMGRTQSNRLAIYKSLMFILLAIALDFRYLIFSPPNYLCLAVHILLPICSIVILGAKHLFRCPVISSCALFLIVFRILHTVRVLL